MVHHSKPFVTHCSSFLLTAVLILAATAAQATVYYVATNGDDANPGNVISSPWATIQHAANSMIAGDQVLIRGGTYLETVLPQNSGAPGNEIVYSGYPGETVIIDPNDPVNGVSIILSDALPLSHLRFENLTLANGGITGFYARGTPGAKSHITLDNVTVENSYYGLLWRDSVTNCQILNSDFSGGQYNMYFLDGINDLLIDNCTIGPTQWRNVQDFFSSNIHFAVSAPGYNPVQNERITIINNEVHNSVQQGIEVYRCNDVIVRDNYVHHNGSTGIQVEANYPDGICERILVEDNLTEHNSQFIPADAGIWIDDTDVAIVQNNVSRFNETGLYITGCYNVIARRNVMYENHHSDPNFRNSYGVGVTGSNNDREAIDNAIVHNTFHRNSANSQRPQVVIGLWPPPTHDPVEQTRFKNNISSECLDQLDLWIEGPNHILDYNNFYEMIGMPVVVWQGSVVSWASYLSLSGQDANSITTAPIFVDAPAGDFALDATSPCVDGGGFLTTTTSAGSGTVVAVADAVYFSDGMGLTAGDEVQIGGETAVVTGVDYALNQLTLDRSLTWVAGEDVGYPYENSAPDIGALERSTATHAPIPHASRASLLQNVPNPFNPNTEISFVLKTAGKVSVRVYDSRGRAVRDLVHGDFASGTHSVEWDGRDDRGRMLASGAYSYELLVDGKRAETRRALLLK